MPRKIWKKEYEVVLLKGLFGTRGFYEFKPEGEDIKKGILSPDKEAFDYLDILAGDKIELTLRKVK